MAELKYDKKTGRLLFTKQMKKEYTILMPNMAPIHFKILEKVFNYYGYKSDLLDTTGPEIAQTGLKYVHNDTCYPALLVIGQFINALQSGKYDVHKVALMITQTGGGCRASNYIFLLRKALKKAGFEFVPVISLSFGMEHNSGFSLTLPLIRRFVGGLVYGDQLMLLSNQTKPYEVNKGESMALVDEWTDKISDMLIQGKGYTLEEIDETLDRITKSFTKIELNKVPKVKVGIVGEIYVKYSKMANNGLEDFLADQDCEVCVPGLMGFASFKVDNRIEDYKMFITDFSSFVFDFAYLCRPVLYFVPDYGQFKAGMNHYRELDLPFEEAFGPLVLDPENAVEEIKKAAENGFELEKKYSNRMKNFYYPLEDCAESLYNEVSSWNFL